MGSEMCIRDSFNIARPEQLMERPLIPKKQGASRNAACLLPEEQSSGKPANSFTYSQRKKMKMREEEQPRGGSLRPESLDPVYVEGMRAQQVQGGVSKNERAAANQSWMKKLKGGDYSGPTLDKTRYLNLRDTPIVGNPRQTEEYRKMCREAVGMGDIPDPARYSHCLLYTSPSPRDS